MTIYVPEAGEAEVTLTLLLELVNQEVADYIQTGTTEETPDGVTRSFMLTDENIVESSLVVYFDDTLIPYNHSTYGWTLDADAGWVTFATAPPVSYTEIKFLYQYKYWSDSFIKRKINQTIRALFIGPDGSPGFYRYVVDDTTLTAESGVLEYDLPDGCEHVIRVEVFDGTRFVTFTKWETFQTGMSASAEPTYAVKFFNAPYNGAMRVSYVARPLPLLADSDDLVEVSGIPTRATEAIVYGTVAKLAAQPLIKRVRADIAVNTQLQGVVFPRDLSLLIQVYQMKYQQALDEHRMPPWLGRLVY